MDVGGLKKKEEGRFLKAVSDESKTKGKRFAQP